MRAAIATVLALISFAANSVLCRLALRSGEIDAATFTTVRLLAGALVLALIVCLPARKVDGDLRSSLCLFAYAAAFSFAYLGLSAGTGALILFGSVQATMIIAAMRSNEHPNPLQWLGLGLAISGLVWLSAPGVESPPIGSAVLMAVAGIAWGFYSLRGRAAHNAAAATAGNFVRSLPFTLLLSLVFLTQSKATPKAALIAVISGAITSGLGYIAWYAALPHLGAIRAAISQLLVPMIAAIGGVLFLSETLTPRLIGATCLTVLGVALTMRLRPTTKPTT